MDSPSHDCFVFNGQVSITVEISNPTPYFQAFLQWSFKTPPSAYGILMQIFEYV
jgi:hypothetical protein